MAFNGFACAKIGVRAKHWEKRRGREAFLCFFPPLNLFNTHTVRPFVLWQSSVWYVCISIEERWSVILLKSHAIKIYNIHSGRHEKFLYCKQDNCWVRSILEAHLSFVLNVVFRALIVHNDCTLLSLDFIAIKGKHCYHLNQDPLEWQWPQFSSHHHTQHYLP